MRQRGRRRVLAMLGTGLVSAGGLAVGVACGERTAAGGASGTILIDGSSTVAPITQAIAEEFQRVYPKVRVPVGISGTGGGLKKFCLGEIDISDASRPIKESEVKACGERRTEYIELPVAFDGLAVVVNPQNAFAACLTTAELKTIWEPAAEGRIMTWRHVRAEFPNEPLNLYGPGVDSGTYDYFTEAVVGTEGASRGDFTPSEDDNVLVQGVAGDPNSLGFFGLAYFESNRDRLKLVSVDGGRGCVAPSAATVADGTYQPLARPLFIYINPAHVAQKPEIATFVTFYLRNAKQLVGDAGYIPLSDQVYALALQRFERRATGSIFAGLGATAGVSLADLLAKE